MRSAGDVLELLSPLRAIALQARIHPAKLAIEDAGGPTSYGALWERSESIAGDLSNLGVTVGTRVAFALDPGAEYVAQLLGAMLAGATLVPVNTRLTNDEIQEFLDPVAPAFAIATEERTALFSGRPLRDGAGDEPVVVALEAPHRREVAPAFADSTREALVVGTGGTTGVPKGALFSHRSLWLWTASAAAHANVRSADVELFFSPFFHGTLVTGLLTTMSVGGSLLIPTRVDAERTAATIASGRITRMLGTPTVFERVIEAAESIDMSRFWLRLLQFGMGRSRPGFTADLAAVLPSVSLMTGYGATEYGPVTRAYSWEFDDDGEPIGVGKPVAGADIRIEVEGELHGDVGVDGEILVNAPWQMDRYCIRDEDLDAQARRGSYLRSGDIGHLDADGNLMLTGRIKETIRSGGETVYPAEVERWIGRHPSVAECAVYGVDDPEWGERVEAAVVARAGPVPTFDIAALDGYLRTQLAGYKVPKLVRVVDHLPLTSNYKIDRRALRIAAEAGGEEQA